MTSRPFAVATTVASLGFLAAGVVLPGAAEALLRLLLATLALGFVVARAYRAMLPARMSQDFYSPFDGSDPLATPPVRPEALRRLARDLGAADDERRAGRTAIPRQVRWRVIDEASRRLADHHALDVGAPEDHPAIRALVSEPTWRVIAPAAAESPPDAGLPTPPLSRLPVILDDLERL